MTHMRQKTAFEFIGILRLLTRDIEFGGSFPHFLLKRLMLRIDLIQQRVISGRKPAKLVRFLIMQRGRTPCASGCRPRAIPFSKANKGSASNWRTATQIPSQTRAIPNSVRVANAKSAPRLSGSTRRWELPRPNASLVRPEMHDMPSRHRVESRVAPDACPVARQRARIAQKAAAFRHRSTALSIRRAR